MEFTPDHTWHIRKYTKYFEAWYERYIPLTKKVRNYGIS